MPVSDMSKDWLFVAWLLVLAAMTSASHVLIDTSIDSKYSRNLTGIVNYTYHYTCPACVNATNTTNQSYYFELPWYSTVVCQFNKSVTFNQTLVHDNGVLTTSGIKVYLANTNKTQTIAVDGVSGDYVKVKFWSNYILPEKLKLKMYNKSYEFSVVGNSELFIPIEIDYDTVNWSQLKNNSINLTMAYEVVNTNYSGKLSFKFKYVQEPEVILVKDFAQYKVNDLIVEKMVIETKVPIKNISINTSLDAETKVVYGDREAFVYITPQQVGDYQIRYIVMDYFGNTKNLTSQISIAPIGTVFFSAINIPSIKVGERAKIKIYKNNVALPINYTLTTLEFIPHNVTLMHDLNLTPQKAMDIFLSDDSDNSYFTELNKTVTITRQETYLNIMPLIRGDLVLRYEVQTPEEIKSNTDFVARITVGNYSIFARQEFNVAGTLTVCELTDVNDLSIAVRKCYTEFPYENNLDNNLIILQKRDYDQYELSHKYQLEQLEDAKDDIIRRRENWLMIFIAWFFITLFVLIYVLLPKDWIVLRIKKK